MKKIHYYTQVFNKKELSILFPYIVIPFIVLVSDLLWFNFKLPINNANNSFYSVNSADLLRLILYPINLHSWPGSINSVVFSNFPGIVLPTTIYSVTRFNYPLTVLLLGYIWQLLGAYAIYYISRLFLLSENIDSKYSFFSVFFYLFNESLIQGNPFLSNMPLIITFILVSYLALFKRKSFILLFGFFSAFSIGNFPYLTIEFVEILFVLIVLSFLVLLIQYRTNLELFVKRLIELGKRVFFLVLVILASLSYLIIPFLSVFHSYYLALTTPTPTYAFGFWPDTNLKLQNVLRLINNWAYFTPNYAPPWYQVYISNPVVSVLLWALPIMALGSILFIRNAVARMSYVILIIVIFLSKANNPPLGRVFVWLIDNIVILRPYYNGS